MKIDKVIQDLVSKDSQRIRESGLEIIKNSQNEKLIEQLIPHLRLIKNSTKGLELGGMIASNNRFYKFPIEIIEFYKSRSSVWNLNSKCTCNLYLSKTYQDFNPDNESKNESIELVVKIKGNWTQDYELKCLKCGETFYVSERHYHWIWWHWEKMKYSEKLPLTGNEILDKEFMLLIKVVKEASTKKNINTDALEFEKERIKEFRLKLAYNKGTEFVETKFGWNKVFDRITNEIEKRIKNEA